MKPSLLIAVIVTLFVIVNRYISFIIPYNLFVMPRFNGVGKWVGRQVFTSVTQGSYAFRVKKFKDFLRIKFSFLKDAMQCKIKAMEQVFTSIFYYLMSSLLCTKHFRCISHLPIWVGRREQQTFKEFPAPNAIFEAFQGLKFLVLKLKLKDFQGACKP